MSDEEKCDCVPRLNALAMDVEGGKDIVVVCVLIRKKEGVFENVDRIVHSASNSDLARAILEMQLLAVEKNFSVTRE